MEDDSILLRFPNKSTVNCCGKYSAGRRGVRIVNAGEDEDKDLAERIIAVTVREAITQRPNSPSLGREANRAVVTLLEGVCLVTGAVL